MTENVLIICSWLDTKTNVGIFFREQAAILKPEFNPVLVVFRRQMHSIKSAYKKNDYYKIVESKTPESINLVEVYYPAFTRVPISFNKVLRNNAIKHLHLFLSNKDIKPSLIHAQSLFDAGFWAYKYHKKFNIPYVITEHNQLSFKGVSHQKELLLTSVLKNAHRILVVSADKIRQFGTNGFFYDFINVGNLVSDEFYYNPNKEPRQTLNFTTIGAYHPLKDQKTLFDALTLVDKLIDNTQINFLWIGYNAWGNDQTENVKAFIKQYQFKNINIELIPNLKRKDVATELNKSDLFIFSSISEGMPVSVLEALACGIPVITSNCGGIDEVVNENNGKIYPVKDTFKLHQYLMEFITTSKVYNGKNISMQIINKYGKNVFKKRISDVFNSVINDPSN